MKEPQLYSIIKDYVQMKKKRKLKPSPIIAGSDFYRSELSKRKLISSNPKNKMKQIFKKFEELDSYIDIEEIVKIYKKSLENESEDKDEQKNLQVQKYQPFPEKFREKKRKKDDILSKVKLSLKDFYKEQNYLKNNKCEGIFSNLQRTSAKICSSRQNNPICETQQLLNKIEKQNVYQNEKKKYFSAKKQESVHKPKRKPINLIQSNKILHKASTYLQMILEDEHRKKWNQKNRIQTEYHHQQKLKERFTLKTQRLQTNLSKKNVRMSHNILPRKTESQEKQNTFSFSKDSQLPQKIVFKKSLSKNFPFRKRKIKKEIMQKLSLFMEKVQDLEMVLQNQNKEYLQEIHILRKFIESQYEKFSEESFISLDEKLNNIKSALIDRK